MADRVSAHIRIGGTLARSDVDAFLDAVTQERASIDGEGGALDLSNLSRTEPLELFVHEAVGGRLETLESFCIDHRLPFVRWCDGYPGGWDAERLVYNPGFEPLSFAVTQSDAAVVTAGQVRELGSFEAIEAYLAAAELVLPLFVVGGTDVAGADASSPKIVALDEWPLEPGKLYLRLYHGRATPDEQLEDWGSEGPVIGPLEYVHTTYMCDVKFAAAPAVMDRFFPEVIQSWRDAGYSNADGPTCDWQFSIVNDLIEYRGTFYGDWSVFVAEAGSANPQVASVAE
jgi:hypothetical protein